MLTPGAAKKVTIYVGEDEQFREDPLYAAILDFLFYRGVSGATVTRGIAGFGADHELHTSRILRLAENLPIKVEFIESPAKVDEIMPALEQMVGTGLIEVQDTAVVKPAQREGTAPGRHAAPVTVPRHLKKEGRAKLVRIFISEADKWREKPLYLALIESLRANDIAGATVYRGMLGYGASRTMRRENPLGLTHDRPVMVSMVETEDKLKAVLPVIEEMIGTGLIAISDVDVIKYSHIPAPEQKGGVA